MRVGIGAQLLDDFPSGVEQYIQYYLSHLLNEADFEVYVYSRQGVWLEAYHSYSNFIFRPIEGASGKLGRVYYENIVLPRLLIKDKIDVFHAPGYILPYFFPRKILSLITLHDLFALSHPHLCRYYNRWYYRFMLPRSIKQSDIIITLSKFTSKSLIDRFPNVKNKVRYIPPGVPLLSLEQPFELPTSNPYILYLGNFDPKKNIPFLVEVYNAFKRTCEYPCDLILAGRKNWAYKEVQKRVSQSPFNKSIHFVGYVKEEQKKDLYNRASLFFFPSLIEGLGFPPMEAMSLGIPTLLPDREVFREVCPNADFFKAEDLEDCVRQMKRILFEKKMTQVHRFPSFQDHAVSCINVYQEVYNKFS